MKSNDGPFSTPHCSQYVFFVSEIFLLDKTNKKTVPVSSPNLRQRTCVDIDERLKQSKDDCTNLTSNDNKEGPWRCQWRVF